MFDDPLDRRPGESVSDYRKRLTKVAEHTSLRTYGNYMSTRHADGTLRGGGNAEMFEKYGFF